jgi:zinc/manganese transport system ATP-binding protein
VSGPPGEGGLLAPFEPGAPSSADPVVGAIDLAAGYGSAPVWAGANFEVRAGEFVAVLGPNGSGKSTLLRVVLGLVPARAGTIGVLGAPPRRGNPGIGYVPQSRLLDTGAAIRGVDLVGFGLDGGHWGVAIPGPGRRTARARVAAAIEAVGASAHAWRRLGELSGGERQRLLLAQALVGEPRLLLLDEPLASLDIRNQVVIAQLVARIARERLLAVLFVAHDVNPLLPVVDRVLYLARGRVEIGPPEEVVTSATLSRLYGSEVDVVVDRHGHRFVVGLERETAHPHPDNWSGSKWPAGRRAP